MKRSAVQIVIQNMGKKSIEVHDLSKTVLQHLQNHGIDWMHACGAKGRCTTCTFTVVAGTESLAPKTPAELKYQQLGALLPQERLACQAKLSGSVTIAVPEVYQLPHINYFTER
jgi:ferredoxin, 2Fe-2S